MKKNNVSKQLYEKPTSTVIVLINESLLESFSGQHRPVGEETGPTDETETTEGPGFVGQHESSDLGGDFDL